VPCSRSVGSRVLSTGVGDISVADPDDFCPDPDADLNKFVANLLLENSFSEIWKYLRIQSDPDVRIRI
jgi:hypothetical protein